MTGKELLDVLEEIQDLKRKLGIEPRIIKSPKGTGPWLPGTRGPCVVCGVQCEATDCIRRCLKANLVLIQGEQKLITLGQRVCWQCSPWTWDWMLERYAQSIDAWPERWKRYEDNYGFGARSVWSKPDGLMELNDEHYAAQDKYEEDLAAKIAAIEKRLG